MGFTDRQAVISALAKTNYNADKAIDLLSQ